MKSLKTALSILLICTLSTACIKEEKLQPASSSYNVDKQLEVFLTMFQMEAASYNIVINPSKLTMQFDNNLETNTLGECYHWENRPDLGQKILINPKMFLSPYGLSNVEAVLFHEFGHCFLERKHKDSTVITTDGYHINASIMNTYAGSDKNYEYNREAYIHELFTSEVKEENFTLIPDHDLPSQFPFTEYTERGISYK